MTETELLQALGQVYCLPQHANKEVDADLMVDVAKKILETFPQSPPLQRMEKEKLIKFEQEQYDKWISSAGLQVIAYPLFLIEAICATFAIPSPKILDSVNLEFIASKYVMEDDSIDMKGFLAELATFSIPSQPPQPQVNPSAQKLEMVSWPEKKTNVCMCDCSGGCGCSQDDYNQAIDDCTLAREALIQEHLKEVGRLKDGLIKIRMAIHQIDGKKKSHEYIDALCKEVLGKEG